MAVQFQKLAQAGHQSFIEHRPDSFAKEPLFGGAVRAHLFQSQVTAVEIAHDVVVAPAVHTLLHGLVRLDAEPPVIRSPDVAMYRVGIDNHAVHVEDQRQFTRQARLPSSSDNSPLLRPRAARWLPALHTNAISRAPRAGRRSGLWTT